MIVVITFLTTHSAFAQMQRSSVEDRVKAAIEKLEPLNLNADQKKKTTKAFTTYYTSQQRMMQEARSGGQRPDSSAFQKLTDERDASLKKVFTEEQYKQFKEELEATLRPQRRGTR